MLQRRKAKFDHLRHMGLLNFEANALSVMPKNVPYLQQLALTRRSEYVRYKKAHENQSDAKIESGFRAHIIEKYEKNGWIAPDGLYTKESAWRMLRGYENPYKKAHPGYSGDRHKYPKVSHHRNGERTAEKTKNGILKELKGELNRWNGMDNDRTRDLKEQIKNIENS